MYISAATKLANILYFLKVYYTKVTEIMTAEVAIRLPQNILPDSDNELVDGVRARTDTLLASGYARSLQNSLLLRKDLILDFTSLKACLDPLTESQQDSEDGKNTKQLQVSLIFAYIS